MLCMFMTELDLQLCQSSPHRNLIRGSCLGTGAGADESRQRVARDNTRAKQSFHATSLDARRELY